MKKHLLTSLAILGLMGCTSQSPITWEDGNQAMLAGEVVTLKSNLWIDKMPMIGEKKEQNLHGALYLESENVIPADLVVESVTLKQGEQTWLLDGDDIELRTHSNTQWEVVFTWQFDLNPEQPVDVAIQVNADEMVQWLVEKNVGIDSVY